MEVQARQPQLRELDLVARQDHGRPQHRREALPQDGRIRRKIAGKDIDMRVATAPGVNGERITIRLLDRSSVLHDLADIGFGEDHLSSSTS